MVHLTQTEHLSCTDANTVSKTDWNEIPHDSRHLGVPSGASNTIYEPTLRSTQTVHQSCRTELPLEPCHLESHRVRLERFLCLWYVWWKPCTYLALTLTLSPSELKRDSARPPSLMSSIGCVQNYMWCIGMFSANRAPMLRQDLHYFQIDRTKLHQTLVT
jgi:hypothetical protein